MENQQLNRRDFIKAMGLGAAAMSLPFALNCQSGAQRPNIIFIMSDDHAAHALSCYGSKINETPNLDRLAQEGMKFNHCFCTNSICAPSRATILTGKHSHLNGVMDNRQKFDGSQMTFPKLLRQAGYQTAMIGKWHLKTDPTGFDYWNVLPGQGQYYNPDFIEMGEKKKYTGYVTDITTDISLDWLKSRDPEKSFCMMLHHKAPHRNWMPGPKQLALYDDVDIPLPETLRDDYKTRSRAALEQEMTVAHHLIDGWDLKLDPQNEGEERIEKIWHRTYMRMTPEQRAQWDAAYQPVFEKYKKEKPTGDALLQWKYQRYMKDYLRCVASVDENVGRVLDYLDETGLAENTIVVYTSDQGFFLGDHGWFDKRFMYEEALKMPYLMRYPQEIRPGTVSNQMILNLDFAPTFLDFANVQVPAEMQGKSIRPLARGQKPPDWRQSMYYHYHEFPAVHQVKKHYGIRTKDYKLIHFYDDIDAWELYDLNADPQELNNVYTDPEYASIVAKLKKELKQLQVQCADSTVPGL